MKKIIFGLGNPGNLYKNTRHNFGFLVVHDWWALLVDNEISFSVKKIDLKYQMNESGKTLMNELKNVEYESKDILIAYDDIELPFGEVQLVFGGSAKGHNGVRSVHDVLGSQDIQRLRLGIGRPPEGVDVRDFVLREFTLIEKQGIKETQKKANSLIDGFMNSNIKN